MICGDESEETIMTEQSPSRDGVLEHWVNDLATVLNVDPSLVNLSQLLDVARDAAHSVTRTAAPIATFLVGVAAAQQGGTREAVDAAANKAQQQAKEYVEDR